MYNDAPQPKAWTLSVESGTTFDGPNLVKIPGVAQSIILESLSSNSVQGRFNSDPACTFTLQAGGGYSFSRHEMQVTTIDFANTSDGSAIVQILAGVSSG